MPDKEVIVITLEMRVPFIKYDKETLNKKARTEIIKSINAIMKDLDYIDIFVEKEQERINRELEEANEYAKDPLRDVPSMNVLNEVLREIDFLLISTNDTQLYIGTVEKWFNLKENEISRRFERYIKNKSRNALADLLVLKYYFNYGERIIVEDMKKILFRRYNNFTNKILS
jgi:hypothetical protein